MLNNYFQLPKNTQGKKNNFLKIPRMAPKLLRVFLSWTPYEKHCFSTMSSLVLSEVDSGMLQA